MGSNNLSDFYSNPLCICVKEQIIQLRNDGKSYKEIQRVLGCSLGTISYHCGKGQKEKSKSRQQNNVKSLRQILKRKKDNFSFVNRIRGKNNYNKRQPLSFSAEEFIAKLTSHPQCYLTGRTIDLSQPKTYQCDHIVPVSKNGTCELDNLGLTCREANMAKNELSLEEFLELCKEVLIHNGYAVNKMDS